MYQKILVSFLILSTITFAQRGGRSWGGSSQGQMDPSKAPKIGIVYGFQNSAPIANDIFLVEKFFLAKFFKF